MNFEGCAPRAVKGIVSRLEEAGFETWAVGGAVRDAMRGSPGAREDWDLATRATPAEVRRLFPRTVPLGIEYGTVGVFGADGALYEVTTFRHDVLTYGRRAVVAFAETLDEDLARRDFTVNAIAWHPIRREVRDPHGGRKDLEDGILRAVGSTSERFREDYLRVLRGLRFAGTLGLEIHDDTWNGLVEAVPGLADLSMERVREELMKVLGSAAPSRALRLYERSGSLAQILPELSEALTQGALDTVDALGRHRPVLRVAALLLFGLRRVSRATVSRLLVRLRFSNAEVGRIEAAMRGGLGPSSHLLSDPRARRQWVAAVRPEGVRDVFRIWLAAIRAGVDGVDASAALRVIAEVRRDLGAGVPVSLGGLAIAGRDLVALGWSPGPGIGLALRALLEAVWEDPSLNNRAALERMVAEMAPPGAGA